jgi:hypothetical protein
MTSVVIEHLNEQLVASRMLMESARRSSKMLDAFSCWLLAGFGALLGFLLAHQVIARQAVRESAAIFVAAAAGTVLQKYLAILVTAAAEGAVVGRQTVEEYFAKVRANGGTPKLDVVVVTEYMRSAIFPTVRWLVVRLTNRALAGDLVSAAKMAFRGTQLQSYFVVANAALLLWAFVVVVRGA